MTSEAPHAVWVLIDRYAHAEGHHADARGRARERGALKDGVETRVIDGVKVQLTTPAKTVADCFRFRRHVGLEVALAALKEYLRKRKGQHRRARRGRPR